MHIRGFASDNNSGVHPLVMDAISKANIGHAVGYGGDALTQETIGLIQSKFTPGCDVYFVYNGTGANMVAIQTMIRPYHAILCADTAHIHVDECGAPEKHAGCKVISIPTPDGKLTPQLIKPHLKGFGFEHHSQPGMVSITQSTEMGTVYTIEEVREIANLAHQYGMVLHMDGARLANAAASLGATLNEISLGAGVDVLSLGGTKNGLLFGEAVVFADNALSKQTKYIRKQTTQLHSKMRFVSAQFKALFTDDLWYRNAAHANAMAQKLAAALGEIPEIKITQKVQANGVFAIVPASLIEPLQELFFFYVWNEETHEVRWMTSFDTTEDDIELFVESIKQTLHKIK